MPPTPDARVLRTRHDVLRAAIDVLVEEGWDAVTQPRVARAAGYAKATVYAHWPDRIDLLRDAFARYGEMPHHEPTGDLRTDLVGELVSFRSAMQEHRLDRALAVLADRAASVPEMVPVRDAFVAEGEGPLRALLAGVPDPVVREAAVLALCGLVVQAVLLHGRPPGDDVLAAAVDVVLRGLP